VPVPSEREEGNERDYGYDQTDRSCQDPRMLQDRSVRTNSAVATEPIRTESDGDTEHEEVGKGKQTAYAKERNGHQLAAARRGPSHTRILGFGRVSLKRRPPRQASDSHHGSDVRHCGRCSRSSPRNGQRCPSCPIGGLNECYEKANSHEQQIADYNDHGECPATISEGVMPVEWKRVAAAGVTRCPVHAAREKPRG
jgi:hypothetical protein